MAFATGPVMLLGLQVLNAWFFAAVAGIGITLFQQIIPRPGLASGLYANTRRIGAIVSGPLIALGSITAMGYGGTFLGCAVLTVLALAATALAARLARADSSRTPRSPTTTTRGSTRRARARSSGRYSAASRTPPSGWS